MGEPHLLICYPRDREMCMGNYVHRDKSGFIGLSEQDRDLIFASLNSTLKNTCYKTCEAKKNLRPMNSGIR